MSDSEDSTVTYTAVSSPFEDGSDIGSPRVDGPPIMPEDPYAYIMAAYQRCKRGSGDERWLRRASGDTHSVSVKVSAERSLYTQLRAMIEVGDALSESARRTVQHTQSHREYKLFLLSLYGERGLG
ncbi:hypothetical protein Tco_0322136 [Tanacetum coccineum]